MLLMRKQSRDEYCKVVTVSLNLEETYVGVQMCLGFFCWFFFWEECAP